MAAHSYLTVIRRICAAPQLVGLRPNASTALHVRQNSGILVLALAPGLCFWRESEKGGRRDQISAAMVLSIGKQVALCTHVISCSVLKGSVRLF